MYDPAFNPDNASQAEVMGQINSTLDNLAQLNAGIRQRELKGIIKQVKESAFDIIAHTFVSGELPEGHKLEVMAMDLHGLRENIRFVTGDTFDPRITHIAKMLSPFGLRVNDYEPNRATEDLII